jgi:proline iminopeptidase
MAFTDFLAFRRQLAPPPSLQRRDLALRGLTFATFTTPAVADATPLLCTNGGLLYDHRLLWPALSPIAADRSLHFWDQRGRGRSQAPPGARAARFTHDIGDLAALIPILARESGTGTIDCFGHSWGAGLTIAAAATATAQARAAGLPSPVRRVVLADGVGPVGNWRSALLLTARQALSGERRAAFEDALAALEHDSSIDAHSRYSAALYPAWFHDQAFADLFTPPRATSQTGAAVATHLYRDGYDLTDVIRGFDRPTLLVHGADDPLPPAQSHATAALLSDAQVHEIAASGHMPFWEQPATFFRLVRDFLNAP